MSAVATALLFASGALAQVGGGPAVPTPNQLPLSGRAAQNGSVTATESPVPGTTTSVNTINPTLQVSGSFGGSVGSPATLPFSGRLSLREAVERGLEYNLGAVGMAQAVRQARGQQLVARSSLLPNVNGALREYDEKLSLKAQGLGSIPGLGASLPAVIGPFNYFDLRATLTQTVADMTALNNYRSSKEIVRANVFAAEDARDLVVFAVGGAYLQTIAAAARVESVRAQLETATALYRQNAEKRGVGLLAQTDVNRSQVQALTQQVRLIVTVQVGYFYRGSREGAG
jgi:outer membrane protein TolC